MAASGEPCGPCSQENSHGIQPDLEIRNILDRLNTSQHTTYSYLKDKQEECLRACMETHVLAILPTGYGKTVIIHALPFLLEEKRTILIVNPLNAIIEEQSQRFGKDGVVINQALVAQLAEENEKGLSTTRNKLDNALYILGHPETFMLTVMKQYLMTRNVHKPISHVVIDESHCILSWGKSDFRPAYINIANLRVLLPEAKFLALTATATSKAQQEIKALLFMSPAKVVSASPDRPNVYIEVLIRPPSTGGENSVEDAYNEVLDPFFQDLQRDGFDFPKTIMYLPLVWCGHAYHRAETLFLKQHPDYRMIPESEDEGPTLIAQYHAPQSTSMKSSVTKSMQEVGGNLRLLFATEAYGMGADAPDVRQIVHVGPPKSMEMYIQELGRCGRDGLPARATLYYNNSDIGNNVAHLQEEMRTFCRLNSCRREFILEYFGFNAPDTSDPHSCCDICRSTCTCETCSSKDRTPPVVCVQTEEEKCHVSVEARETAHMMLLHYFKEENALCVDSMLPSAVTGLSEQLAHRISQNVLVYSDLGGLKQAFPLLSINFCENIVVILRCVRDNLM